MNCEYCQSPAHIWFQCPKKPDGWKPARLATKRATPEITPGQISLVDRGRGPHKSTAAPKMATSLTGDGGRTPHAGTQALPVDTMPSASGVRDGKNRLASSRKQLADASNEMASQGFKSPAGQTKFDKKTWQRNYMRTYLRQYREDVKTGKRVPKKREC